ncbi:hypothetical protein PG990_004983 [Apiospora arundinis]
MGTVPVPAAQDAPFPLTEVDKWILSLTDEEYTYHDWEDMKTVIGENNLSVLKRKPSDLRKYMTWTQETKARYGSMTNYLLENRLPKTWGSPPFTAASQVPFHNPSDYRVLVNDWPYGLTPDIRHIVVWSRTPIATDPKTGDMTPASRGTVEDFVKRYFVDRLGPGARAACFGLRIGSRSRVSEHWSISMSWSRMLTRSFWRNGPESWVVIVRQ